MRPSPTRVTCSVSSAKPARRAASITRASSAYWIARSPCTASGTGTGAAAASPRALRIDEFTGAKGRDAWVKAFDEAARRKVALVDLGGIALRDPIIVMAECDLVTAIYKGVLKDPDDPNRSYEAFAFETVRVKDGKIDQIHEYMDSHYVANLFGL